MKSTDINELLTTRIHFRIVMKNGCDADIHKYEDENRYRIYYYSNDGQKDVTTEELFALLKLISNARVFLYDDHHQRYHNLKASLPREVLSEVVFHLNQ